MKMILDAGRVETGAPDVQRAIDNPSKGNMLIRGRNCMKWNHEYTVVKGGQGRIGQPSQLHIRRRTSLMLSDEELQSLYETMLSIQNALRPAKATKSQVDALAVRVLSARLKVLESESRLSSWDEVVKALIEGEME
jgi:hypothetical protein